MSALIRGVVHAQGLIPKYIISRTSGAPIEQYPTDATGQRVFPVALFVNNKPPPNQAVQIVYSSIIDLNMVRVGWITIKDLQMADLGLNPQKQYNGLIVYTPAAGWSSIFALDELYTSNATNIKQNVAALTHFVKQCVYGKLEDKGTDRFADLVHTKTTVPFFVVFTQPACVFCATVKEQFHLLKNMLRENGLASIASNCFVVDLSLQPQYTKEFSIEQVPAIMFRSAQGKISFFKTLPRSAENMYKFIVAANTQGA